MGGLRIVAGRWGGRRLAAPAGRDVRPTSERVREAWMSMLAPALGDASVLDLFAGSGILGLEALSRGADRAVFVESDPRVAKTLAANIESLDAAGSCALIVDDVFRYLEGADEEFDVAFADPPYGQGLAGRLVARFRQRPFARILSVEYRFGEPVDLPPDADERRYGDTALALLTGPSPSSSSSSPTSSSSSEE